MLVSCGAGGEVGSCSTNVTVAVAEVQLPVRYVPRLMSAGS